MEAPKTYPQTQRTIDTLQVENAECSCGVVSGSFLCAASWSLLPAPSIFEKGAATSPTLLRDVMSLKLTHRKDCRLLDVEIALIHTSPACSPSFTGISFKPQVFLNSFLRCASKCVKKKACGEKL